MSLLLAVVSQTSGAPHSLESLPQVSEAEWLAAFALAREHHVLPSMAAYLHPLRTELPPAICELLVDSQRQIAIDGFFWSQQLRGLLQAFAAEGIPVIPLKGPFLALRLYGHASRRPCRDLDLLVASQNLPAAEQCLQAQGFTAAPHADDYHRSWYRQSVMVELHFGVENPLAFDFDLPSVWSRAVPASFEGQPAWKMAAQDELLYLCLHGLRHGYRRLSDVLDVLRGLEGFGASATVLPAGHALFPLLTLGSLLAGHLKASIEVTGPVQHALPQRALAKLTPLAAALWQGLLTQQPAPLDWAAQHRLYLRLETTANAKLFRSLRHLRILASRVIVDDYNFAARFGLYRPWQARLLRPIRLLKALWSRHSSQKR